jgi:hypothetical protein
MRSWHVAFLGRREFPADLTEKRILIPGERRLLDLVRADIPQAEQEMRKAIESAIPERVRARWIDPGNGQPHPLQRTVAGPRGQIGARITNDLRRPVGPRHRDDGKGCCAVPIKLAIRPMRTTGCAHKRACNASAAKVGDFSCDSIGCAKESACNAEALCAPAPRLPRRGSNRGSAPWPANGADWPLCSPCGTVVWSSSADGADCAGEDGITLYSADTYVVCACSSACPLTYANDWKLRRA